MLPLFQALVLALSSLSAPAVHPSFAPVTATHTAAPWSASAGKPYTSREGGFSIVPPSGFSKFDEETRSNNLLLQPDDVKMTMHTFMAMNKGSKALLIVSYTDYPKGVLDPFTPAVILDSAVGWMADRLNCTPENPQEITLSGFPGRSAMFFASEGKMKANARIDHYLVNTRLYQVAVIAMDKKAYLNDKGVRAAFASFKLTDAGKGK